MYNKGFEIPWKTAPRWAKYAYQDYYGYWHWANQKPVLGIDNYSQDAIKTTQIMPLGKTDAEYQAFSLCERPK